MDNADFGRGASHLVATVSGAIAAFFQDRSFSPLKSFVAAEQE
jgi:hypothetical protein